MPSTLLCHGPLYDQIWKFCNPHRLLHRQDHVMDHYMSKYGGGNNACQSIHIFGFTSVGLAQACLNYYFYIAV